jgi:hypothetical protein
MIQCKTLPLLEENDESTSSQASSTTSRKGRGKSKQYYFVEKLSNFESFTTA